MARTARAKATPEVLAPFAPATPPGHGWGMCGGCMQERRTEHGTLVEHRAWHTWLLCMLPCQGSGETPLRVTT